MTREELKKRFQNITEDVLRLTADDGSNSRPDRVASAPVAQPSSDDEHMAEDAGEAAYQGRCLVSITSFRVRLCDERNLYDKHFVDALKEAGAFIDDSPQFVKVEVRQQKVDHPHEERTLIILSPCP